MAKLTLTDGTIFEGTTEEIFAITERFNGVNADEPKPISEGDIVVITGNTNKSRNKVGDIGKVGEGNLVHVPQRPPSDSENGNWTRDSEMRHATPTEIAEYEKALAEAAEQACKEAVFTQAGRNPNEYRKGDIVRAINTMATGLEVGHVGAVTGVDRDGDVYLDVKNSGGGKAFYATRSIEPITFAESRLDRN